MGINDHSPLDDFYVTSISKDEAVQKLLGWQINCGPSGDLSDEEQEGAGNASISVLDVFDDQRIDLENALFEAKHPRLSETDIAEKESALAEFDKKIYQAKLYLCAIDDELSKGNASALRLDKNRQGNAGPYITIHSFNEWVRTTPKPSPTLTAFAAQEIPAIDVESCLAETPNLPKGWKMRAQEKSILEAIRELGHDPKSLPKAPYNKPGVKSKVKKHLEANVLFYGKKTVFEKAWYRLGQDHEIISLK